ncbi:MAG: M20/M25/M40 family metallo-hydrolase [Thaumarchaeota archaeon]|nr:M20/M25/M40 family metallo-hydrolase [Nitrososphaerota archaeon]
MLLDDRLEVAVEEGKREAVRLVQDLCRQPSVSAQNLGVKECSRLLESMMKDAGLETRIITDHGGQPIVYGERIVDDAKRTLLFYDHYDVQPPEPLDEWKSDPFSGEVRDGFLFARGASDNKGNIVARLQALKILLQVYGKLPSNVKFLAEGEEEVGSPFLHKFVEANMELLRADGCMWEGASSDAKDRPVIALGAKGLIYIELRVKGPKVDMHSSYSTLIENPAWRLVEALSALRDDQGRVLVDGFYDDVEQPSVEELEYLEKMPFDEERLLKKDYGVDRFVHGLSGLDAKREYFYGPTCNIAGINSGYTGAGSKTVLPKKAFAKIDLRMVPKQDPQKILASVKKHVESKGFADFQFLVESSYEAARTPMSDPFVRIVESSAKEIYGVNPVIHPSMAGSGPMYLFVNRLRIPTASIGIGHFGSKIHAPNENIRLEDLYKGIRYMVRFMQTMGNQW